MTLSPCWKMSKWASTMSTSNSPEHGLPDVAALAQLANQFFSSLPSSAPTAAGNGLPAGLSHLNAAPPALPGGVSALGGGLGFSPSAAPQAGAGHVPNALSGDLPLSGPGSRVSPTEFGVPGDEELKHLLSSSSLSHPRPASLPNTN